MLKEFSKYDLTEDLDSYILLLLEKRGEKEFKSRNSVVLIANIITDGFYHKEMFTFSIAFERSRSLPTINVTIRDREKVLSNHIKRNMRIVVKGRLKSKKKENNFYYLKAEKLFFLDKNDNLVCFVTDPYMTPEQYNVVDSQQN